MMLRSLAFGILALAFVGCEKKDAPSSSSSGPTVITPAQATETAPAQFTASFDTSRGAFSIQVTREWSPQGADRFYNLVKGHYFDNTRFFRVVPGFMVQWGIHGDGQRVNSLWNNANIPDDPPKQSNTVGMLSFAMAGPNSRTTQVFINYGDNTRLDSMGFAPFGKVVSGMDVVNGIHSSYGETPNQGEIQSQGNEYLGRNFPNLDFVKKAEIAK